MKIDLKENLKQLLPCGHPPVAEVDIDPQIYGADYGKQYKKSVSPKWWIYVCQKCNQTYLYEQTTNSWKYRGEWKDQK